MLSLFAMIHIRWLHGWRYKLQTIDAVYVFGMWFGDLVLEGMAVYLILKG